MDYMNLGVRSRKTGLNAKENIKKDEYSMESIDEFFKDDESSVVSSRGKSRRSTLLSLSSNIGDPVFESRRDSQAADGKGFKVPNTVANSSRRSSRLPNQYQSDFSSLGRANDGLDTIRENDINFEDFNADADHRTPSPIPQASYAASFDGDSLHDSPSIRLTPRSKNSAAYKQVPDLIEDDEDTRDFTSLNTSENALLEDELDDDYMVESEEDNDYVEGASSLEDEHSEGSAGSEDSDDGGADGSGGSDSSENNRVGTRELRHGTGYGLGRDSPTEVYDSDEEYIQSQAADLIGTRASRQSDGVRRSTRVKIAPLEYWRNEKVVYKKSSGKPVLEIDKIITYDHNDEDEEEEEEQLGRRKKRNKSTVRTRPYNYIPTGKPRGRPKKSKTSLIDHANANYDLLQEINSGNVPSAQWLKFGILEAKVNVTKDSMSDEIIAFAPNLAQSEQTKESEQESFSLEVMFDKHKDHFASGMLKLPTKGNKRLSDSHNAFITFYVIQGIIEVSLADKSFMITEGSTFQVPAFNKYSFENKGNNDAKMFFVQVTVTAETLERKLADGDIGLGDDEDAVTGDVFQTAKNVIDDASDENTSSSNMSISEI